MKINRKSIKKGCLFSTGLIVAAIAATCVWVWTIADSKHQGAETRLYFPSGSTPEATRDTLASNLGAYGEKAYKLMSWQGTNAASGSYVVRPGDKALALSRMLRQGRQEPVRATFNNSRTLQDLAEKLCKNLEITPEQFLAVCDTLLPANGFGKDEYEAAFLPDTYEFYWNAKPERVAKRLLDFRSQFWNDERRAKAQALGLTPVQVATLASIVEEETAKADERPKVARLYLNRLDKHMLLQADPTVKYAVGDPSLERILNKHLEIESPYNTYKHPGLPPGPIRVPSASSIDAVLNAPQHNYLYMCAKDDCSGYHNFAVDYNTHLANARKYQAELNRRGIK